jgi:hypothetical protein
MTEQRTYAVYFHPQALDALGDPIKPYLTDSPAGQYLMCRDIDTGGAFCEMNLAGNGPDGKPLEVEVMVPTGMIRLIISISGNERDFGFG